LQVRGETRDVAGQEILRIAAEEGVPRRDPNFTDLGLEVLDDSTTIVESVSSALRGLARFSRRWRLTVEGDLVDDRADQVIILKHRHRQQRSSLQDFDRCHSQGIALVVGLTNRNVCDVGDLLRLREPAKGCVRPRYERPVVE
jgi:hypothetical protein